MASETDWLTKYPKVNQESWLNKYPKVEEKPFFDLSDTLSATGRAFTSLGTSVPASMRQAFGGLENPWQRSEGYAQSRADMRALQEELNASEAAAMAGGDASSVSSSIREATPSLGFSGSTLVPSLAAGAVTALATKSPAAARSAAAGTSLLMAYRMAGAQFLDDSRERIDNFFQEKLQRPLTPEEQNEAYEELLPLARKFGAAEAGPEALGNMALGGAGKYIRKALGGKNGIMSLASNALSKVTGAKAVGAGVGAAAGEVGTEAITAVEQDRINKEFKQSVLRGEAPESVVLPDRTVQDYTQGITNVAPTTLAMTGLTGLAGLGPTAINRGYRALRPQAEQQVVETEIVPEEPTTAPAPTDGVVTTLPFNREDIRATDLPFNREDIRASELPFTREDIRPTQLPFNREDIRSTELPFSRQNIRGLSQLGQPAISPGLTAAVNTADSIVTTAENTSSDVSQATTAARNIIQGVVNTPQPQVAPAIELPAVTPSPAMEMPENLSQTITDSNGEIAPEMSVLPPTVQAGAGVGEAIQPQPIETAPDAIQEQITDEGLLRQERPEMELQGLGEGNAQPQEVAAEGQIQEEVAPPITPQGTPTPATEGTVMPGGSAIERDVTKPEQMTPEEALTLPKKANDVTINVQKTRDAAQESLNSWVDSRKDRDAFRNITDKYNVPLSDMYEVAQISKGKWGAGITHQHLILLATSDSKPVSAAAVDTYGIKLPQGYVKQGDLYVFQPTNEAPPIQDTPSGSVQAAEPAASTTKDSGAEKGQEVGIGSVYQTKLNNQPQWAVQTSNKRGFGDYLFDTEEEALKAGEIERKNSQSRAKSIEDLKNKERQEAEKKASQEEVPRKFAQDLGMKGVSAEKAVSVLSQPASRRSQSAGKIYSGTKADVVSQMVQDGYIPKKRGNDFVLEKGDGDSIFKVTKTEHDFAAWTKDNSTQESPQTTTVATPTETAAPLAKEAAVASVVQQPAEGSIPAFEQESATTAIESNEKADIADAAMAFLEEDLIESKRQWSPEKIAAAKAYFASGGKDMDVLRAAFPKLVGSRPIVQAYLKADKEASEAQAKRDAADAKLAKEIERDEKEQAKAEAAQKKRDELNLKTLNSLIQKTRTNVVQGTVNPTDANQAVAILNRSGEIPNVLFTWIGTSKDFLADPANRVRYPETWAAVSANSKIEGMSENGQPIVFTDNVGVSDLDRKLANLQGTTPEVAAVRRVILHENIHKGMFFLSMKEKMQIFSFLRRMYSPQELDSLAESYSEYSDWRTNQVSYFSILEEAMTRDFDSMVEIPRDGILAEFMQFLRGIWQKITGKTSEPTLKDYKDVLRLIRNSLKNSEKVNADILVNGGKTKYETYDTSVRPYASEGYGSQRMEGVSTGDNSPRAQAIRKAVSESNWNELSPTQRAKAMEDFGLEAISSRYSFDATLLPVRITNKRTNEGRPASLFIAGANPSIEVRFDTRGLVQLQNSDATTAFAFIYDVAQEEIIHTAQHLNTYKLWQDNGSVGEFEDFEVKQYTEMLSEMYQAAADGLKNGDVKAANVIVTAWNIYNPQSPTNDIQVILQSLAQSKNAPAFAMEVGRQLLQFKRQDFTTETGWMRFVEAMKALLTDITNALKTALTMAKNGQVGKRLQDEISEVNALMNELESASQPMASKVEYDSPNDAAFNSGAEVARNTDYDERDKEVRSTIRAAYDIAPKTNGPSVPLDELFSIVKQSMPDLTETEFSRILQGLYEDSGALLIEGESPFATFTTEGERAGSAIIMPPTDMTKDDVISMLRGMSAANPAPSGGINQELYDTVLTRLRDFISNGGRIPLPIQLDRSGEANMDNYTGKKAGLGGGLRQGSGVGRAGQTDSGTPLFDGLPEGVQGVIPQAQRVESEVSRNREAIAGRGENREGKAGARPDMGMASGGYTFADYAQIASRIGARVQEVSNDIGGGLAVMADENGATTILINAAQLSERMAGISFGLDEASAFETIGNALVEELIHAADLAVQREAWIASGRRKPFTEFAIDSDKSMLDEMREVVASSNDPVKATRILFDAIQASRQLYGAGATPSDIDELFSSPNGNISIVMSEFVRQMIQQDMHQTVSEASLFRRFIERVMKMLQKIRDAIAPAKAGEFGDILKNRINETEMMLAMAYQQTGARASMIDPEDAATKQFAKNIKDINSGTTKAPFGGVQFTNFKPIDREIKSSEEYSDNAIKYVNNLENEGVSLDDIANSVISPAFLESIGIEQDLMAQDALTIEVRQRVDNAAREAKSPDRKKQLSKLSERLSAFWQGVGSKKGQHLGQRRYLVNKARYSWMFIREIAEKVMKEARTNILISNFGSENATSLTQNSYENSDKANQQAVDEIAQDVVNNNEWALIKEGEQVFEGADKTLWERAKMLVRRFAFYKRRKDMKVANAKASMTDAERSELNAILQMSDEEADAAEAKDLAEFRSIMGKLLGEESPTDTPTEKKKRKKRKEIIDTVEKRVAEGQPIEPTAEEIANEIEIAENKASQIVYRFEELYRQGFKNPPEGMSKKEQKDSIIRAFRDQVKNPVSFEQFAERLGALKVGEEVSERLFLTASRERSDLARMKKFKIEKRRVEIADKQASRLIYSTEERLRQGSKDLSKSTSGDSINKAFKDQVSDPVEKSKFAERLAKLDVSPDVAERLFKTAEREKTDLEAMAAFNILQGPKALQRMINEINNMRRGEEIPLRTPIPWRQLLSQSAKTVEEYRQRIFDAISANEELKNATPEQKARLADLFAEAWESKRKRILDSMQERLIREQEAKGNLSKKAAKALQENRMRIVEDINLGIFDNDEIAKIIAEKFGIKSEFTETEREKINSLIEVLQDEGLNAVKRQVAAYKLLEVLQGELKIPVVKMIADFWVSSVLSGPNTIVSIGLAVASGAFELSTALSRVFISGFTNPKQLPSELAGAYKTLARLLSAFGRQANIAWQYLVTGDPVFLDPSMNDVTENMQWANIGKSNQLAEQMAKSDKILVKSAGLFMRTVSRLLKALDVFNGGLTKEGSLSIVFRQIGLDPEKIAALEKKSDLKPYKDAIIQKDFGGTPPKSLHDKAIVDSYALADMMKELDKFGKVSENANQMAMQGAMTLEPSGLGGVGYRAIRSLVTNAEAGSDRFLKQAQRGWSDSAQNGDRILSGLELAFAYLMQFSAYNVANFGGVRFARFAGNKFNQGLSFIPGIGFARAFEAEFDPDRIIGKEAFIDSIQRNQLVGVILSVGGYYLLKAIAEEPDDEKRGGLFINGGWGNLTPEKKQQKLAAGEKEYTIGYNDTVFSYANWPISSALAAIGSLADLIRFSPDQWNDKNVVQIMASAAMSGAAAAADIPALSQFQELFGNSLSSKDPNEKRMERFAKVMSSYAGGFVPRFLKDIDYAQDPNLRKYETLWEKTASHIPVYRRYEGKEYYDILGQQIQRNVYPGSREFMVKPTDPAYKVLGALISRGIWLTPANAEHRMVGKGARRRSLTQEEADNYSLETGKGYKQMLLRYGQRALQMPTERAKAFLLDKADDVRDRVLKKVYRGYTPAS
jgi:hypothetical protein